MRRRQFLQSATAAVGLTALPALARSSFAATPIIAPGLTISTRTLDINNKAATVYSLTNDAGKPGLVFDPGERFLARLKNDLSEETIIHWHGLTPPNAQDGVPDNPLPQLKAGESRNYDFPIAKPGTFWMHAHTLQEQNLLAAPLIVHSTEDVEADRQEVVVLLHDFSFTPAEELLSNLNGGRPTSQRKHGDMAGMKQGKTAKMKYGDMGAMEHMGGMDLNDISYDAYLANDRTLDDPEIVSVDKGGKILLRIINGAASTAFTISTGSLKAELRAVDGRPVAPLTGNSFSVSMAQRLDLLVEIPKPGGSFPILALREGAPEQTGIILATQGAVIAKLASVAESLGPMLDLTMEAQLRTLEQRDQRKADHAFMVHLVGDMASYSWGMMGAEEIAAKRGERIEIGIMNMSMMAHPMHLHGHDFQVVAINAKRFPGVVRDTVLVPPMTTVTIAVDINNPGEWPFHCHHLYHMVSGMMVHIPVA